MSKSFKKILFSSLVVTLFVISNLIALKYTALSSFVVSLDFMTYPFMFLAILLLFDNFEKKDAYYAITSTIFIQMILLIVYVLTSNMARQLIIPDMAYEVSKVFYVDEIRIMGSLIAFMIANYFLIYVFDLLRKFNHRVLGAFLSSMIALTIYSWINIIICNYGFGKEIIMKLILGHSLVNGVIVIVITLLFLLLKEKTIVITSQKDTNKNNLLEDHKEKTDKKAM